MSLFPFHHPSLRTWRIPGYNIHGWIRGILVQRSCVCLLWKCNSLTRMQNLHIKGKFYRDPTRKGAASMDCMLMYLRQTRGLMLKRDQFDPQIIGHSSFLTVRVEVRDSEWVRKSQKWNCWHLEGRDDSVLYISPRVIWTDVSSKAVRKLVKKRDSTLHAREEPWYYSYLM